MEGRDPQAWLIARDSNSLADLFHNMRYEGHPALWQLLLYIPAHISWNPISMQAINYVFAVAEAWLILSARKLHWSIRGLTVFSFFVFYQYGVVARNYMLAMLLLTAAARCLLGDRPHRRFAILLLALSINTHFFAIPVAAVLAFQMFCIGKLKGWKDLGKLFRDFEFQAASVLLFASVLATYFTMRPPADLYIHHYGEEHHSLAYYFLSTESRAWQALIPPNHLTERVYWLASHPHPTAPGAGFSLALFLLLAAALRTVKARSLFLIASALVMVAMAATLNQPAVYHFGLIFTAFILALLTDAYTVTSRTSRPWLPQPVAFAVVLAILGLQTLRAVGASRSDWNFPYSYAKETSSWLRQAGLDNNPLVVMSDSYGSAVLGYMQRPTAYYPACRCVGSFAVWRAGREGDRVVTEDELENLSRLSPLPVVVISAWELPAEKLPESTLAGAARFFWLFYSEGRLLRLPTIGGRGSHCWRQRLLWYAVTGTPNRFDYAQGLFLKNGDGSANFKPFAHLYKSKTSCY